MGRHIGVALALAVAVLGPVVVAPPAEACTCAFNKSGIDTVLDHASAAFVGIAVNRTEVGYSEGVETWREGVIWVFEVETVLAGELPRLVEVSSGVGEGDCGYDFSQSGLVGVVAHSRFGGLTTNTCGGVWNAQELLNVHGPGYAPLRLEGDPPIATGGATVWWWVTGGLALAGLASALTIRSTKRRDDHHGWTASL